MPFSDLAQADLRLDAIYEGGSAGNAGDDPIRYLLPCGNQGGIRFRRNGERYAIAVLFTSGRDPDWPDFIDPASGLLTYFGDNKTPGHALHETARRGNVLLRECFASLHALSPERQLIPPFFVFESTGEGRDVRFRGLAAPGASELSAKDDLVAVWRSTGGERFQNYRARFTILDEPVVPRDWIDSLVAAEDPAAGAPASWREWVRTGSYCPLLAPPTLTVRSREDQLPDDATGLEVLSTVHEFFSDRPHAFERCAVAIWRMIEGNVGPVEVTRPAVDGGRDAVGVYYIGPEADRLELDFALEAKCYALGNSVKVRDAARLISRLRYRQFGVLVTTSYLHKQAYSEIREDRHPVVVVSGADIVTALRNHGYSTVTEVRAWLEAEFPP